MRVSLQKFHADRLHEYPIQKRLIFLKMGETRIIITVLFHCLVQYSLLSIFACHSTLVGTQLNGESPFEQHTPTNGLLLDEKIIERVRSKQNGAKSNIIMKHDDTCYDRIRLPDHIRPMHYNLVVEPNMNEFTFQASIDIDISVNYDRLVEIYVANQFELSTNDTRESGKWKNLKEQRPIKQNEIVLHLDNIDIIDAWYSLSDSKKVIKVEEVCISDKYQVAVLKLELNLVGGEGRVHIDYNGIIRNDMNGFYRSKYTSASGEIRYHAITQFEATYARAALPCFDEPAFKATFDITLVVPNDRLALANTHSIAELDLGDGTKAVRFATTPMMSTYLLAFIIGEFDYIEGFSRGRPIRVYTPLGKTKWGAFALDVAMKSLPFLEDYFKIEFPLSKLDFVAVPDFEAGAMENWGLITYRETQLLIDEQHSSVFRHILVAQTVVHELAHQWFGNLVTMLWWDDLWLNEGFATYMEFFVVDQLFPEYSMMVNFVSEAHSPALKEDALHSTHPIQASVNDPSEIDEIFDDISYNKGASTVKLIRDYLTDEIFREGLQHYLSKNAYKNTVTDDLWDSFEIVSEKPIKEMMFTWTNQAGFPCLEVEISKHDQNSTELLISQRRFFADGYIELEEDNKAQWIIPLAIITAEDNANNNTAGHTSIMSTNSTMITTENSGQWIKLNPQFSGFYRVEYSKQMREALYLAIQSKQLSVLDRMNLLTDAQSLTFANRLSARELLKMIDHYKEEDDGSVWQIIDDVYADMKRVMKQSIAYKDQFNEFGQQLFETIYNNLGWDKRPAEPASTTIARSTILFTCLLNNYKPVIEEGLRRFDMHITGKQLADPSIRGVIYHTVAKFGDDSQFNKLFELYEQTDLQESQNLIAYSLGHVEEHDRVLKVIDWMMSDSIRDSQRSDYILAISSSNLGKKILWKEIDNNFDKFLEKFGLQMLRKIILVSV